MGATPTPLPDAIGDLSARLARAFTTASNDDLSEPGTDARKRHVERLTVIQDAMELLRSGALVSRDALAQGEPVAWQIFDAEGFATVDHCDITDADRAVGYTSRPLYLSASPAAEPEPVKVGEVTISEVDAAHADLNDRGHSVPRYAVVMALEAARARVAGKSAVVRDYHARLIKDLHRDPIGPAAEPEPEPVTGLVEGIRDAITWHEDRDKELSKQPPGGDRQWRRMEHQEEINRLSALISAPPATQGGR